MEPTLLNDKLSRRWRLIGNWLGDPLYAYLVIPSLGRDPDFVRRRGR